MRTTREGRLLRLTLDRPEKRNALSFSLCADLVAALDSAASDSGVGAILLEADGSAFCAGMDLDESVTADAAQLTAIHERLFTFGATFPKPMVAAVQGPALGGGVGLVANAHIAVAAENATFTLPEIRIAMWPFVIWRALVSAIGERRTLELALTGRTFTALDALDWGLVHIVAADASAGAHEIALQLAQASPETIAHGMRLVRESRGLDGARAGQLALALRSEMLASADFHEGVSALREKRAPRWPSLERSI